MTEVASIEDYSTHFVNRKGQSLGGMYGLLGISLYEGMQITIHSHSQPFKVVEWRFHHGHPDENAGLTIVLE